MKNTKKAWSKKLVENIANKYVGEVVKAGIPVSAAYLFGSYAKGNSNFYSDIDVCIVSEKFGKDYFRESVMLGNLANNINYKIEAVPMNPNDMNDKYSTLASEVKKFGILVS